MAYLNLDTGEVVLDIAESTSKTTFPAQKKAIGMDLKFPVDCKTPDQLISTLATLDNYLSSYPTINYAFISDSLISGFISAQEGHLLTHLSETVVGWNYWMGNKESLTEIVPKGNLARVMKSLESKGLIEVLHLHKPFKNDIVLLINPYVGFKGSYLWRWEFIGRWYGYK